MWYRYRLSVSIENSVPDCSLKCVCSGVVLFCTNMNTLGTCNVFLKGMQGSLWSLPLSLQREYPFGDRFMIAQSDVLQVCTSQQNLPNCDIYVCFHAACMTVHKV